MKAEDFLTALNEADDSFVKKAGRKAGYFPPEPVTGTERNDAVIQIQGMRQETAKQRNAKRIWVAAACLVLIACSWGGWQLLRQNLPGRADPSTEPFAGSTQAQSTAASTASVTTEEALSTENPSVPDTTAPYDPALIERLHHPNRFDPIDVVIFAIPELRDLDSFISVGPIIDEVDALAQLALDLRGGLGTKEGFGAEIAELLEQGSQDITVVNAEIWKKNAEGTDVLMRQYYFLTRGQDGFWTVLDVSEPKELAIAESAGTPADYAILLDDAQLSFTPRRDPTNAIHDMLSAWRKKNVSAQASCSERLEAGYYIDNSDSRFASAIETTKTVQTQRGLNTEILRRLEEDPENTAVVRIELSLDFRSSDPPRSKIDVIQFFYLVRGENKNWVLLDASYPS